MIDIYLNKSISTYKEYVDHSLTIESVSNLIHYPFITMMLLLVSHFYLQSVEKPLSIKLHLLFTYRSAYVTHYLDLWINL